MLKYSRAETGHLKNHLANRKSNTEYNSDSKKKKNQTPKELITYFCEGEKVPNAIVLDARGKL